MVLLDILLGWVKEVLKVVDEWKLLDSRCIMYLKIFNNVCKTCIELFS
jgi:hypothetical protein